MSEACLEGTVTEIIFRNDANGFTVLSLQSGDDDAVTAVGVLPFLAAGEPVRLYGTYTTHAEYGRQLKVERYETIVPTTPEGIEQYLIAMVDDIGPATAKLIVAKFGLDTFDIILYAPEKLRRVPGIGPKRAARIAASFGEARQVQQIMLFLQQYGVTPSLAMKIYHRYGNDAISAVKTNPYQLIEDVDGIGFRTADAIARSMGIPEDAPFRLHAGVRHVLSLGAQEGHVCLPYDRLIQEGARHLGIDAQACAMALQSLLLSRKLILQEIGGMRLVYQSAYYTAEVEVAQRLARLASDPTPVWDDLKGTLDAAQHGMGIALTDEQRSAVSLCAGASVALVTGGPGTGKTTLLRCLLRALELRHQSVLLCAPTGRAARRMSEATSREAYTIHRLLEFGYGEGDAAFQRNEDNPLDADALIVDEASMIDIFLMRALLGALKGGTRLLLVGDEDQLPSVGPGSVLGDMLQSTCFSVARLTQIHRQSEGSMIVENAHRIRRGELPVLNQQDFYFISAETPDKAAATVVDLCARRLVARYNVDPLRDIQVLCPMHKGEAGVQALNAALQQALNPPRQNAAELHVGTRLFRQGDKVMQMKNDYQLRWRRAGEDGEGVFNGDGGWIESIDTEDGAVRVRFDDGRAARYEREQLDALERAYAISIHKSQGSEFPIVILPLMGGPPTLMTRNLLYTAITRARTMVVVVGRNDVLRAMVGNEYVAQRCGALRQRIGQEMERVSLWSKGSPN